MPLDFSQSFEGLFTSKSRHCGNDYTARLHEIKCPDLPFTLKLSFLWHPQSFSLEWEDVQNPVEVAGGTIEVSFGDRVLWTVPLASGVFPPSATGILRSAGVGGVYADATIRIMTRAKGESRWALSDLAARTATHTFLIFVVLTSLDLPPYTYADSDDEIDDILPLRCEEKDDFSGPPCKVVRVTDTTYSTYFSVLVWIATGSIVFAPLVSSPSEPSPEDLLASFPSRISRVRSQMATQNPLLPPPVSPKSAYRLAHLLELPTLAALAPANLKSQLSPANAASELYGDVACAYDEVREIEMQYVVETWEEVKE
ncbi:hypothetical protein JCM10213_005018 [Rhodosporidiobolus nylandii]